MDRTRQADSRDRFMQSVGLAGGGLFLFNAWLVWRIGRGPGDGNPLGMVFAWAALLSQVPACGLLLRRARRPLGALGRLWAASSLVILAIVALLDALVVRPALGLPVLLMVALLALSPHLLRGRPTSSGAGSAPGPGSKGA